MGFQMFKRKVLMLDTFVVFLLFISILQLKCVQTQDSKKNLVTLLRDMEELASDTFIRLLFEANLAKELSGKGPFTVLVPTNKAFEALNPSFLSEVRTDVGRLRALLLGHVFPGSFLLSDFSEGHTLTTLLGDSLTFTVSRRGVSINGAFISAGDFRASNGVFHVVDRVLIFQGDNGIGNTKESISDKLSASRKFNILKELLLRARLFDVLSKGGPFTVFAPPDQAFSVINPKFLETLKQDQLQLRSILLQHIVPKRINFEPFPNTKIVKSLSKNSLWITTSTEGYYVNGSSILQGGVEASNGVIHVIQSLLMSPEKGDIIFPSNQRYFPGQNLSHGKNVVDVLSAQGLSAFSKLMNHAELMNNFVHKGPFTFFVPSDEAFSSLHPLVIEALKSDKSLIKEVILNHVVKGVAFSTKLLLGWKGTTLLGENIFSSLLGSELSVSGSKVVLADVRTSDGVIHVISDLILPSKVKEEIPLLIRLEEKGLNTFSSLLKKSGLSDTQFQKDPYTIFVPSDSAFKALSSVYWKRLEQDPDYLKRTLLYHIIPKNINLTSSEKRKTFPTALGGPFKLWVHSEPLRVNEARIIVPVLNSSAGVVYLVDNVLLPPTPIYSRNPALKKNQTIFDFEILGSNFSIMAELAEFSGILDTVAWPEAYTVFMPPNAAFLNEEVGALMEKLRREREFAKDFILAHVVPGKFFVANLTVDAVLTTLNGNALRVRFHHKVPYVNGIHLNEFDILTPGGVANKIERPLLPPQFDNVADILTFSPELSIIAGIWSYSSLLDLLRNESDYTLLVPKNQAFVSPEGDLLLRLSPHDAENLLQRHLLFDLNGPRYSSELCWTHLLFADGNKVMSGIDEKGEITLHSSSHTVHIVVPNLRAKNGVVHIIDKVL